MTVEEEIVATADGLKRICDILDMERLILSGLPSTEQWHQARRIEAIEAVQAHFFQRLQIVT